MNHRSVSTWIVLASILSFPDNGKGADIRVPAGLRIQDPTANDAPEEVVYPKSIDDGNNAESSPRNAVMTLAKGFRCKGGFDGGKKGSYKECEGGVKKTMGIGIPAGELADDIAIEVEDMHKSMIPDHKSLLPTDETMIELIGLDDMDGTMTNDEDCSSEEGCTKTVEFGGYFKLFWGCNVTFTKKGKKISKDIACGGKSFQGMGKKQDVDDKLATNFDVAEYEF